AAHARRADAGFAGAAVAEPAHGHAAVRLAHLAAGARRAGAALALAGGLIAVEARPAVLAGDVAARRGAAAAVHAVRRAARAGRARAASAQAARAVARIAVHAGVEAHAAIGHAA